MSNWIDFVKRYANAHRISYGEALTQAGASYRSQQGGRQPAPNYRPPVNMKLAGGKKKSAAKKPAKKGGAKIPNLPKRYYDMGYELGGVVKGGAKTNKGALAALLSGLDARVNIK